GPRAIAGHLSRHPSAPTAPPASVWPPRRSRRPRVRHRRTRGKSGARVRSPWLSGGGPRATAGFRAAAARALRPISANRGRRGGGGRSVRATIAVGPYQFNWSVGESGQLASDRWLDPSELLAMLRTPGGQRRPGDVYACLLRG